MDEGDRNPAGKGKGSKRTRTSRNLKIFLSLVDQLSDGIFVLDPEDSRVLDVNDTACRNLGYSREELMEMRLWDFSESVASLRDWQPIAAHLERMGSALFETRHRRRNGTFLDVDVKATVLPIGRQRFIVGIARDATERRRAEEYREEVLSLVSHEMRSPLTNILGYSEYLLEKDAAPELQREFLVQILKDGERLKDLVDNLLSLQRLRAGFGLEDPAPVPLHPLLREVAESFRPPLVRQQIELDCGANLPPVFGEAEKIHQAVKNLLGNAVKYSPLDGRIVLGAQAEGAHARVWVRDEGPGIPADKQERIFERFYRLEGRKGPAGTGLGLALVRAIAQEHGGRAWVESMPGKGSTFYLTLPFAG